MQATRPGIGIFHFDDEVKASGAEDNRFIRREYWGRTFETLGRKDTEARQQDEHGETCPDPSLPARLPPLDSMRSLTDGPEIDGEGGLSDAQSWMEDE